MSGILTVSEDLIIRF